MIPIFVRYVVGGVIAALAAKGVLDASAVEGTIAAVSAVVVGLVEYVRRKNAL